ncbi:cellulose binding domain-containing protein [Planosporangium sp. 12N6]|uniref:cellulose binding domain-containing protein n=1 Tax=Planosporangium spinosum TaxID=3402278 RepID=UPI003CF91165
MRKLLTAVLACLCAVGSTAAGATSALATGSGCTGTVQITSLTFNPPTVSPGQTSTATLTVQNCTNQPQQLTGTPVATWVSATGTGIPAGCPVIDPLPLQVSLAAGGSYTTSIGYSVFSGCTAIGLHLTVTFYGNGTALASHSADLTIGAGGSCAVDYRNSSEWPTGFVAQVTMANTGAVAVNGWSLAFSYPGDQQIVSSWGGTARQSGAAVTVGNLPYNASIPAGGSVTFGIQGTWRASDQPPTSFTLNGQACRARQPTSAS